MRTETIACIDEGSQGGRLRGALLRAALCTAIVLATTAVGVAMDGGSRARTGKRGAEEPATFERLANSFLEKNGLQNADPESFDFAEFLRGSFVRVRLGLFEVMQPVEALQDKDAAESFIESCAVVLATQQTFLSWVKPSGTDLRHELSDLDDLRAWVRGWSAHELTMVAKKKEELDLLVALDPKSSVVEAAERFAREMVAGHPLGMEREEAWPSRLILIPDRETFVEFVCFGGWLYPGYRDNFWRDHIAVWTECLFEHDYVIALEYGASSDLAEYEESIPMNMKDDNELAQHVAYKCGILLLDNFYADKIAPAFAAGLALNLVIDQYGYANTRSDGSGRANTTLPQEAFVPGGLSEGGVLPPVSAESRWRQDLGKDHFVAVLSQALEQGSDEAERDRKHATFLVEAEKGGERRPISGPFFGRDAEDRTPTEQRFVADFMEFFRAYKSAFLYWLQTEAGSSRNGSAKQFGELLIELAQIPDRRGFDEAFAKVYDKKPLSSRELTGDDLEGRFLRWLGKQ